MVYSVSWNDEGFFEIFKDRQIKEQANTLLLADFSSIYPSDIVCNSVQLENSIPVVSLKGGEVVEASQEDDCLQWVESFEENHHVVLPLYFNYVLVDEFILRL
jgi:hypothetical protein